MKQNFRVSVLLCDDIYFKTKDKGKHYMIKGSIQEEGITILNIYASNIGAPKYIRQILTDIKGKIDNNII